MKDKCTHEALTDTGVGYYRCPACKEEWSYSEWENRGLSLRDELITGTFAIGADGQKEPPDWKQYALKLEAKLKVSQVKEFLSGTGEDLVASVRQDSSPVVSHPSGFGNSDEQRRDEIESLKERIEYLNEISGEYESDYKSLNRCVSEILSMTSDTKIIELINNTVFHLCANMK